MIITLIKFKISINILNYFKIIHNYLLILKDHQNQNYFLYEYLSYYHLII